MNSQTTTHAKTQTKYADVASGRAFSGSSQWGYRARVDPDGTVLVYDDVAGCYTLCHALTRRQQAYVRRVAVVEG